MTYHSQPSKRYDMTETGRVTTSTEANTVKTEWHQAPWVRYLLESTPAILSLCERKQSSDSLQYDFAMTVKLPDGQVCHRWLRRTSYDDRNIRACLADLLRIYGETKSLPDTWVNDSPPAYLVKNVINLHKILHPDPAERTEASSEDDTSTGGWASAAWVMDLFNNEPSVVGLGELHTEGGGFNYDFAVAVKLLDGSLRYHLLTWTNFNYNTIKQLVHTLRTSIEDGIGMSSRWLESPLRRTTRLSVNRQSLGLAEPKPETELNDEDRAKELAEVFDEHGSKWLLLAFQTWPTLKLVGRRRNKSVSPNTYMFQMARVDQNLTGLHATWMKCPDMGKLNLRVKSRAEAHRWKAWDARELEDCRLIITRAEVFKYYEIEDRAQSDLDQARKMSLDELTTVGRFKLRMMATNMGLLGYAEGKILDSRDMAALIYEELHKKPTPEAVAADREERIAQGHERRTAKGDEEIQRAVVRVCVECGCSLKTNLVFGRSELGDGRICGECELKHEAEQGTERTVQESLVFARRKIYEQPLPKRNTRFDPRPGIDDVSLGGSGPNWED